MFECKLFLKIAFCKTKSAFLFNWGVPTGLIIVPAVFVMLIYFWRGEHDATNEAVDIVLYFVAYILVILVAIILTFLHYLWLAPFIVMNGRLDNAIGSESLSHKAEFKEVSHVDVSLWNGTQVFQLGDAACLWVEVEPHNPITDVKAKAAFTRLSGAMKSGQLPYTINAFTTLVGAASGESVWPKHTQVVFAISLRKYADQTGSVPLFLQSVEVPLEHESKNGENLELK